MSDAAFPSHITAALDRLSPPPLPRGFADRLVARIEAGDLPANVEVGSSRAAMLPASGGVRADW